MGGGDSSWQGHKGNVRAVIAQESRGGAAAPFFDISGSNFKRAVRTEPPVCRNAMASGLPFDGLEVCEVIPKGGSGTCLGQNKHGETWL